MSCKSWEGLGEEEEEQEQGDVKTVHVLGDEKRETRMSRLRGRRRGGQGMEKEEEGAES
jgi:hypothetical protein